MLTHDTTMHNGCISRLLVSCLGHGGLCSYSNATCYIASTGFCSNVAANLFNFVYIVANR